MSERFWNVALPAVGCTIAAVFWPAWASLLAACFIAIAAGVIDVLDRPSWEKAAILLSFGMILLVRYRVQKLDKKLEEIRMGSAAVMRYLDIEFRNRRTDLPPGAVHLVKDDFRQGLFSDKLLTGCYAARDLRRVTLADDLKSAGLAYSDEGRIER
jgi:hypothetical protein